MIYEVKVADRVHRVELEKIESGWRCKVDGQETLLDAVSTQDGVLSLLLDGKSYEIKQENTGTDFNIVVGGLRFPTQIRDPRSLRSRRGADSGAEGVKKIVAPMPGKVVRILAQPGTAVEHGQGVIVIEAMKMQNELKSPKKGIVKKLTVHEGTAVEAGQSLAEVE